MCLGWGASPLGFSAQLPFRSKPVLQVRAALPATGFPIRIRQHSDLVMRKRGGRALRRRWGDLAAGTASARRVLIPVMAMEVGVSARVQHRNSKLFFYIRGRARMGTPTAAIPYWKG